MILCGDVMDMLKKIPDCSVQTCITSPPYWGLRDYGHPGQIGLEKTPEEYVAKMVQVFREVKRVLRDDGTVWLNLGDSYAGSGGTGNQFGQIESGLDVVRPAKPTGTLKPKDLVGIPWRVAFALQADGWYLRQDIIWAKPNPMPESVADRCTKSHEYIFLLTKSPKYYYDAESVNEQIADSSLVPGKVNGGAKVVQPHGITRDRLLDYDSKEKMLRTATKRGGYSDEHDLPEPPPNRNRRSVWTVTTKPFSGAHFATFPQEIPTICIKAGSRAGDTILDPFAGAGTTLWVAKRLGRKYIGIELNERYIKELIEPRLENINPLFEEIPNPLSIVSDNRKGKR